MINLLVQDTLCCAGQCAGHIVLWTVCRTLTPDTKGCQYALVLLFACHLTCSCSLDLVRSIPSTLVMKCSTLLVHMLQHDKKPIQGPPG